MPVLIRVAVVADAAPLSKLGVSTFRETFERFNTAEDMAHFLAKTFSPEKQKAEIADAASTFLVAESPDGELAGYAYLAAGAAPASVNGEAPFELKRFYMLGSDRQTDWLLARDLRP